MSLATFWKATTVGVFIAAGSPVFATTLTDALIQAYQTNPSLRIGRSSLRATDETVRQGTAELGPTITSNVSSAPWCSRLDRFFFKVVPPTSASASAVSFKSPLLCAALFEEVQPMLE